jgi:hypothetical protein
LGEAGGEAETVASPVNSFKVCEGSGGVSSLPEEVYEILCGIVAETKELAEDLRLALVEVIEIDSAGASHDGRLGMFSSFDHSLAFWSDRTDLVSQIK